MMLNKATGSRDTSDGAPELPSCPDGAPINVLLVESNDEDARAFRRAFECQGVPCKIERLARGEDALERLNGGATSVDIVIAASDLVGISGLELCAELLARGAPFPLIMLAGAGSEPAGLEALRLGVDDCIIKDPGAAYLELLPTKINCVLRRHEKRLAQLSTERAYRTREEIAYAVFKTVTDGVITIDVRGLIGSFNPGAERQFGYTADEVVGHNISMLMPQDMARMHGQFVRRHRETGKSNVIGKDRELTAKRKDGTIFPIELIMTEMRVGGERHFTGVMRDITERKRALGALCAAKEQAELASRSKSEFLANMSHELRTPLNAIIGFSTMIQDQIIGPIDNAKYLEYASDINHAGHHLLALINDILDLAKIEAGKLDLHEELLDFRAVIGSCIKLITERGRVAGVRLDQDLADAMPRLMADARMLKQILLNLLSNSIKFTPAGGSVCVRAWFDPRGGHVLQVADTGVGIAPEDIPKAMETFGQIDSALNRKFDGTGLGLPLTNALVELHGGSLTLDSDPGIGTTVTIRFPLERANASPVSAAAPAVTAGQQKAASS